MYPPSLPSNPHRDFLAPVLKRIEDSCTEPDKQRKCHLQNTSRAGERKADLPNWYRDTCSCCPGSTSCRERRSRYRRQLRVSEALQHIGRHGCGTSERSRQAVFDPRSVGARSRNPIRYWDQRKDKAASNTRQDDCSGAAALSNRYPWADGALSNDSNAPQRKSY